MINIAVTANNPNSVSVLTLSHLTYPKHFRVSAIQSLALSLMLSLPNAHEPFAKIQFTGSFYFRIDNVDQFWEQIRDKAPVVYPIENFEYGMHEFAIRDNNGYILQFGQEIPN